MSRFSPSALAAGSGNSVSAVNAEELGVRYGQRWVLRGLSLTLGHGLVGILGPNGAGKSTLLRVLVSLQEPAEGLVRVTDAQGTTRQMSQSLGSLGYLGQNPSLPLRFTAREFVEYSLWLKGCTGNLRGSAMQALSQVGVTDDADSQLRQLSGGTRQRVALAGAIAHQPGLLILDEPTVGLDPRQRMDIRGVLHGLARDRIVLLSTHIVEDVSHIADRVLVLTTGRLSFDGTPQALADLGPPSTPHLDDPNNSLSPMSAAEAGYSAVLARTERQS